jgi:hypothetical protein
MKQSTNCGWWYFQNYISTLFVKTLASGSEAPVSYVLFFFQTDIPSY